MDKSRILEIVLNFIAYCEELKERDSAEDKKLFYQNIIGLDDEEMKYLDINLEESEG